MTLESMAQQHFGLKASAVIESGGVDSEKKRREERKEKKKKITTVMRGRRMNTSTK